jgi:hypothetical protein
MESGALPALGAADANNRVAAGTDDDAIAVHR